MLMRRTSRRGIGDTLPAQSFFGKILGTGNDCSQYFTWLTNAGCWGSSPTEWATQMTYGNILPTLGKGASTQGVIDYSNPSSLVAGVQDDPQSAINAAVADQTVANQAANLLAVQTQGPSSTSCSNSIIQGVCDWIVYAMAAAVVVGVVLVAGRHR